jgi:hypothetical protein
MALVLFYAGLRLSELAALDMADDALGALRSCQFAPRATLGSTGPEEAIQNGALVIERLVATGWNTSSRHPDQRQLISTEADSTRPTGHRLRLGAGVHHRRLAPAHPGGMTETLPRVQDTSPGRPAGYMSYAEAVEGPACPVGTCAPVPAVRPFPCVSAVSRCLE